MKKITFLNAVFFMALLFISNVKAQTLVAHYAFDNNYNSSGGTYTEALTVSEAANFQFIADQNAVANSAVEAIGSKLDYFITPTNFPISGNTTRTYAIWFKPPAVTSFLSIGLIDAGDDSTGNGSRMSLSILSSGDLHIGYKGGGTVIEPVSDDTWTFAAIVWDGTNIKAYTSTSGNVTEKLNGAPPVAINTAVAPLYIGNSTVGFPNRGFMGSISDVKIFEGALTEAQVNLVKNGSSLGVKDIQFGKNELKLTSTVVRDQLNVETKVSGPTQLTIYNLTGKAVKTEFSKSVNVSGLASGLYIVKVRVGDKVGSLKFIKK